MKLDRFKTFESNENVTVDQIRQAIAESGKTKLTEIVNHIKARFPKADIKVVKQEAKDMMKDMHKDESVINESRQPKNEREVKIMILALEKQREALPQYTAFGDNNWEMIDHQIDILKGESEFSDTDDVYDQEEELGKATWDIALAFDWMDGNADNESLVDDEHYTEAQQELDTLNRNGAANEKKPSICPKMCKECPFSKNAMPGWLADYTVKNIQDYMSHEAFFPCHMMMPEGADELDQQQVQDAIESGEMKFCRGYVESMIKSGKMPYKNKALVDAYNRVKAEGVSPNTMDIFQFSKHHERK